MPLDAKKYKVIRTSLLTIVLMTFCAERLKDFFFK